MKYDHGKFPDPDQAGIREEFQAELSALADGELDEAASARALLLLETEPAAAAFFEDLREQIRLHKDLADPERLFARLTMTAGTDFVRALERAEAAGDPAGSEAIARLAAIFYQLGKSYVLAGTDPGWSERVFERAVNLESAKHRGRGLVDAMLLDGESTTGSAGSRIDWLRARGLLNGRLERIEEPLEKGRRLLEEATAVDPAHEEARLYLAFLDNHAGKTLKAAQRYRDVFDSALGEANRGHAAVQLGRLYSREDDFRKALVCFRWVGLSGLAARDSRFAFVRFNIAGVYARMGARERAIEQFRLLLDEHPERRAEHARAFAQSTETLLPAIRRQPGFLEELHARCPELFAAPPSPAAAHAD